MTDEANPGIQDCSVVLPRRLRMRESPADNTTTPRKTNSSGRNNKGLSLKKTSTTCIKYNPNWSEKLGISDYLTEGLPSKDKCIFCLSSDDNTALYGKLLHHTYTGLKIHNFCMLLASGLSQQDDADDESKDIEVEQLIYGFAIKDILKDIKRCGVLRCGRCRNFGATIGCAIKKCKKSFHLPCAIQANALPQFYGTFNTFCIDHRPVQRFLPGIQQHKNRSKKRPNCQRLPTARNLHNSTKTMPTVDCCICMDSVTCTLDGIEALTSDCCKDAWFHRECIQQYAKSSGLYFFKCPKCKNGKEFMKEMQRMGVYVPDCDASWEQTNGAFSDLLHRHNVCDAQKCLCPYGPTHHQRETKWSVVLCDLCGSSGVHIGCNSMVDNEKSAFACEICVDINGWKEVRAMSIRMGIITEENDAYLNKIAEQEAHAESPAKKRKTDESPKKLKTVRPTPSEKHNHLTSISDDVSQKSAQSSLNSADLPSQSPNTSSNNTVVSLEEFSLELRCRNIVWSSKVSVSKSKAPKKAKTLKMPSTSNQTKSQKLSTKQAVSQSDNTKKKLMKPQNENVKTKCTKNEINKSKSPKKTKRGLTNVTNKKRTRKVTRSSYDNYKQQTLDRYSFTKTPPQPSSLQKFKSSKNPHDAFVDEIVIGGSSSDD